MKAELRPIKAWIPHKDKDIEMDDKQGFAGSMNIYVGSLNVGWVQAIGTEPQELFVFHPSKLIYQMDTKDQLVEIVHKKKGKALQEILDGVELLFKEFLSKVVT